MNFQPHWAEMLLRLDEAEASYGAYRAADGHMSFATPSSEVVTNLIQEFRHVIRYAQDCEQGNEILRAVPHRCEYCKVV